MQMQLAARPAVAPPSGRDVPIVKPHVSLAEGDITYLGAPLDVAAGVMAALRVCDGLRRFRDYDGVVQEGLTQAIGLGLACWAPAEGPQSAPPGGTLVISPHPDDAILSLGSWLCDNAPAVIANVFSIETWARQPYYLERPELTKQLLVEEDRAASRMIGAFPEYLGFVDAPLRGPGDFLLDEGLKAHELGAPHLLSQVRDALVPRIAQFGTLFAPAGVGGHVDHLICREVILQCIEDGLLPAAKVLFYEELPYAALGAGARARERIGLWCRDQGLAGPAAFALGGTERARSTKADALTCYRLQLTGGMLRRVMAHGWRLTEGQYAEQVLALDSLWIDAQTGSPLA